MIIILKIIYQQITIKKPSEVKNMKIILNQLKIMMKKALKMGFAFKNGKKGKNFQAIFPEIK